MYYDEILEICSFIVTKMKMPQNNGIFGNITILFCYFQLSTTLLISVLFIRQLRPTSFH